MKLVENFLTCALCSALRPALSATGLRWRQRSKTAPIRVDALSPGLIEFDARGWLLDWWTKEDLAHFQSASSTLVAQYSAYKPFPDLAVNGALTLSENLADLGGLGAAYDAYHAALGSKAAPADADKQFFTGYAQSWRTKLREAALRCGVLTDSHAPASYRTATVRNIDAW